MTSSRALLAVAAVVVLVAALGAVYAVWGTGGGLSPEEAMAATVEQIEELTSFAFIGKAEMEIMGQEMVMDLSGEAAMGDSPADTAMAMEAAMDFMGQSFQVEERLVGGKFYMKTDPDPSGAEPQWYAMDMDFATMQEMGSSNVNPSDYLQYVEAFSSAEKIGTEEIDGVTCTHYSLEIDMSKLSSLMEDYFQAMQGDGLELSDEELAELEQLYENMEMTIELFVDGDNLPRREIVDMSTSDPVEMRMKLTMDLFDFNSPVEIFAPEGAIEFPVGDEF